MPNKNTALKNLNFSNAVHKCNIPNIAHCLMNEDLETLNSRDIHNSTAFDRVVGNIYLARPETIKVFLEHGSLEVLNARDSNGDTAFNRIIHNKSILHDNAREVLLRHGSLEVLNALDSNGDTAFNRAFRDGETKTIKQFLDRGNVKLLSTLFRDAVLNEKTSVIKLFLDNDNLKVLNNRDFSGQTAFEESIAKNKSKSVKIILKSGSLEILNHQGRHGLTPFHKAAYSVKTESVDLLLDHQVERLNSKSKSSATPILHSKSDAINLMLSDAMRLILKECALLKESNFEYDPQLKKFIIEAKDDAKSLIDELMENGINSEKKFVPSELATFINVPIYCDQEEIKHRTALQTAAESGNIHVMLFLVEHGANINAVNKDGQTALDFAKGNFNTNAVSFLEDKLKKSEYGSSGDIKPSSHIHNPTRICDTDLFHKGKQIERLY